MVEVSVRNSGANEDPYDGYLDVPYSLSLCSSPTLSTGGASSPYASGSGPITLTGGGSCAGGTQFKFYYRDTAGVWHLLSGYASSNTTTWNADYRPGSYMFEVDLRPAGSAASYVTYLDVAFSLSGCGTPTLSPDKASPQVAGNTVTWTANATCTGTPEYRFEVRSAAGVWSVEQAYGASNTFVWSSPTITGAYMVEVSVRNSGANEDPYDGYLDVPYLLK
jgi:hypothetical protein